MLQCKFIYAINKSYILDLGNGCITHLQCLTLLHECEAGLSARPNLVTKAAVGRLHKNDIQEWLMNSRLHIDLRMISCIIRNISTIKGFEVPEEESRNIAVLFL